VIRRTDRVGIGVGTPDEFDGCVIDSSIREMIVNSRPDLSLFFESGRYLGEPDGCDGELTTDLPDVEVLNLVDAVERR
jgi:hypothetical protein